MSAKYLRTLVRRGKLPSYRLGGIGPRRFRRCEVERLLEPESATAEVPDLSSFISNTITG
ncbi:MAG: helix-turn-helix domain-containing protein [Chloroflexi bacterium]|nr:helix-turn-helix domain-containing protein [Chloroflexota bacterium]